MQRALRHAATRISRASLSHELSFSSSLPTLISAQRIIGDDQRHRDGWGAAAALFAGIVASGGALTLGAASWEPARCDQRAAGASAGPLREAERDSSLQSLRAWLEKQGAQLTGVEVRPCSEQPEAGLGVYASVPRPWLPRWLGAWPRVLAEFPLSSAITSVAALSDPAGGPVYRQLLQVRGCADARVPRSPRRLAGHAPSSK